MPVGHIQVMVPALPPSNFILHPLYTVYSIMLPRVPALVWEDLGVGKKNGKKNSPVPWLFYLLQIKLQPWCFRDKNWGLDIWRLSCAEVRHLACYVSKVVGLGCFRFVSDGGFLSRRDGWICSFGAPASDLPDTLEKTLDFPVQSYRRPVIIN